MTLRAPAKEDERMKAQKLGLFLGMNMAVACMVMQGCCGCVFQGEYGTDEEDLRLV